MANGFTLRSWSTPLTIGVFILMSVTGVMMFFELNAGLVTQAHEWFSWAFLFAAGAHIITNIRPFKTHLKSTWGRASIVVFTTVLVASLFSWGVITGTQLLWPVEVALVNAPLTTLADLTKTTPDALVARMKANGITAASGQSLHDIAVAQGVNPDRLLIIVFMPR